MADGFLHESNNAACRALCAKALLARLGSRREGRISPRRGADFVPTAEKRLKETRAVRHLGIRRPTGSKRVHASR